MASMNISIPESLSEWVRTRVEAGHYAGVSEYVRELIRKDQMAIADRQEWLGALKGTLDQSIADADAGRLIDADEAFDRLEAKYLAMAEAREKR